MFGWFRKYVKKIGIFGVEVEFHPPTNSVLVPVSTPAPSDTPKPNTEEAADESTTECAPQAQGQGPGLTFDQVIQAILASYPNAVLGQTAQQGQYHARAIHLANYKLYTSNPPWYGAQQPNGKVMWLYLGKGGKICCGDKQ